MRLAHLYLASAMAMVGANVAVAKAASPYVPVFIFALIRFGVAVIVLVPLAWAEKGRALSQASRTEWRDMVLQALFGTILYMFFLLYGVKYTSALSAGIITSTVPAIVAALAVLMLGERFGSRRVAALALAVLGIAAVNTANAAPGVAPNPLLGNLLIAGAVISEGLFIIYAKRSAANLPLYRMTLAINLIGLVAVAPFSGAALMAFDWSSVPPPIWLLPVFYSLTSSVIAMVFWYRGLAEVPASEAAIFTSTFPISAVAVSLAFLGEELQWAHAFGLICVLTAIWLEARGNAAALLRVDAARER
jgi:drug/metabolite transporter (DMT)-like permease